MTLLELVDAAAVYQVLLIALLVVPASILLYRIAFHPLRGVPGPLIARSTSLWFKYHVWAGDEPSQAYRLHETYGPVVRVAPNVVDIADGEALNTVYTSKGGFLKAKYYANFGFEEYDSLFSFIDPEQRKTRLKHVMNVFIPSAVSAKTSGIRQAANDLVKRIRRESKSGEPINLLNLARSYAIDSATGYCFGKPYGALLENREQMSASAWVNAFVASNRFFYTPKEVFHFLESAIARMWPDTQTDQAAERVEKYASSLVRDAKEKDDTYQARFLDAGFTEKETKFQCMDLMFAGTDSLGMNLTTICWHLVGRPQIYTRLRKELLDNPVTDDRLQSLPYLKAVVQEGLRLAFATPVRLPRVVPEGGWNFKGHYFPAGTEVGLSTWQLHHNPEVYESPNTFNPDRWLEPTQEMQRDFFPFGLGARQCIAKNLATAELYIGVDAILRSGILEGAERLEDNIVFKQWFNSKVDHECIQLVWQQK